MPKQCSGLRGRGHRFGSWAPASWLVGFSIVLSLRAKRPLVHDYGEHGPLVELLGAQPQIGTDDQSGK
eukprot:1719585-Heterocapsa_arctica.AAC.1